MDEAKQPSVPPHPEPRTHQWSSLERAAIERYGDARVAAALAAHQPSAAEPVVWRYDCNEGTDQPPWWIYEKRKPPKTRFTVQPLYSAAAAPPVAVPVGWVPISVSGPLPEVQTEVLLFYPNLNGGPPRVLIDQLAEDAGLYWEDAGWLIDDGSAATYWHAMPVAPAAAQAVTAVPVATPVPWGDPLSAGRAQP